LLMKFYYLQNPFTNDKNSPELYKVSNISVKLISVYFV
jgi:hypothetical protein